MPHTTKAMLVRALGSGVLFALLAAGCQSQKGARTASDTSTAQEQTTSSQQVAGARASTKQRDERAAEAQEVIQEAADAVQRISASDEAATFQRYVNDAAGFFIFPDVKKGALLVGGSGGRGVLVARREDGSLSSPAFFSIGSGSVGLQLGYERSTVVLFLMNDGALDAALDGGFQLGTSASVASGTLAGEGRSAAAVAASDVISIVESAGGVYAGASIEGAVIDPIRKLNASYYSHSADPRAIVLGDQFTNSKAGSLMNALGSLSQGQPSSSSAPGEPDTADSAE